MEIQKGPVQFLSNEELLKFNKLFPVLTQDVLVSLDYPGFPVFVKNYYHDLWVQKMGEGRKIRAEILILGCKFFVVDMTDEDIRLSYMLGWIVEIINSASVVTLPPKDQSACQQCGCGEDIVTSSTLNEMNFLSNAGFMLANKYFGDKTYYKELMRILHIAAYQKCFGQSLDRISGNLRNYMNSSIFNMNSYNIVAEYKSTNSFYLPVALAMVMSGINNPKVLGCLSKITLQIGAYIQSQEEFLEVFGLQGLAGTTDSIAKGKYAWPIVTAIERSNSLYRNMLLENYGFNDSFKICVVKTIFERLNIEKLYRNYECEARQKISIQIENLPMEIPKPFFQIIMAVYLARYL